MEKVVDDVKMIKTNAATEDGEDVKLTKTVAANAAAAANDDVRKEASTPKDKKKEEEEEEVVKKIKYTLGYVITVQRDQIYRKPPPENAHLYERYTRAEAMQRHRCTPCRRRRRLCIVPTIAILVILFVLALTRKKYINK